jgi:hypothetical protein
LADGIYLLKCTVSEGGDIFGTRLDNKWIMRQLGLLLILLMFSSAVFAQSDEPDTLWMVEMKPVNVTSTRNWTNDTVRYRYNQTKYYITTILPYLNSATKLFAELDAKVKDPNISRKQRKQFVNGKEDELRTKFEDEISKLNTTQGILLIKLIARQTGVNIYDMLGEFKNPFTAIKWQTWARLNGHNLNKTYNPIEEPMLEHIMESLDYPLPSFYQLNAEVPKPSF